MPILAMMWCLIFFFYHFSNILIPIFCGAYFSYFLPLFLFRPYFLYIFYTLFYVPIYTYFCQFVFFALFPYHARYTAWVTPMNGVLLGILASIFFISTCSATFRCNFETNSAFHPGSAPLVTSSWNQ